MEPDIDALRVFLRVGLAVVMACLIATLLTDGDRTITGMAGMTATGAAVTYYILRGPKVGN